MSEVKDLFDDLANGEAPDESAGFVDVPHNKWYAADTCTEDHGGAAPKIRTFDAKKTGITHYIFKTGLTLRGAEASVDPKVANNQMLFLEAFIVPKTDDPSPISSRMTGIMNAVLAPGVGSKHDLKTEEGRAARRTERWRTTLNHLRKVAEEEGLTPAQYEESGGTPAFLTGCFVTLLNKTSHRVLVKSRQEKNRDTKEVTGVGAGSFEDYSEENCEKRKIKLFDPDEALPVGEVQQTDFNFD